MIRGLVTWDWVLRIGPQRSSSWSGTDLGGEAQSRRYHGTPCPGGIRSTSCSRSSRWCRKCAGNPSGKALQLQRSPSSSRGGGADQSPVTEAARAPSSDVARAGGAQRARTGGRIAASSNPANPAHPIAGGGGMPLACRSPSRLRKVSLLDASRTGLVKVAGTSLWPARSLSIINAISCLCL